MNKSTLTRSLLTVCVLANGVAVCECGIIPNQMARAVQIETYTQRYVLSDQGIADRVFSTILGADNVCQPEVTPRWASYLASVASGRGVTVHGGMTITLSQSPWNPKTFVVEGMGEYLAQGGVDPNPQVPTVIASANVRIVGHSPTNFDKLGSPPYLREAREILGQESPGATGYLTYVDLVLEQWAVREFEPRSPRYASASYLVARVWLRRQSKNEAVYFVADDMEHELGLASANTTQEDSHYRAFPIGCIRFQDRGDRRKVLDVRAGDSSYIRKDYPDIMKSQDGGVPDKTTVAVHVDWEIPPPFCSAKAPLWALANEEKDKLVAAAKEMFPPVKCPARIAADAGADGGK